MFAPSLYWCIGRCKLYPEMQPSGEGEPGLYSEFPLATK
jgi:hypothetical protein